jgi:hypothetical protein
MSPPSNHDSDQLDGAWKCALDWLLEECLQICFPAIAEKLDFSRPIAPLDTELHQPADGIAPTASAWHADRVIRCHTRLGSEVCLHIEVQCQRDEHFAERMFVYHALLYVKYRLPVISLGILGDDCIRWRPCAFGYQFAESDLCMRFGFAKLLDLEPHLPVLLQEGNGFALFVAAHLQIIRTKGEPFARLDAKCILTDILSDAHWGAHRALQMCELLDRLMQLPPEQDKAFRQHILRRREGPMLSLMERLKEDLREDVVHDVMERVKEKIDEQFEMGREERRRKMLHELMEQRFGPLPRRAMMRLTEASPDDVARWTKRFCTAESIDELLD